MWCDRFIVADPLAHAGKLLEGGRYEVKRRIGVGGFKTVWRAFDRLERHDVALSILHESQNTPNIRERFWQEAQMLRTLTLDLPDKIRGHKERVVGFLNFGELKDDDPFSGLYLVTRFVEGPTLRQFKKRGQLPLSIPRALAITTGILQALKLSHTPTQNRGPILHRDIKPANIIVGDQDQITVLDFGVSKLVETTRVEQSEVLGTLQYMAPEQLNTGANIGPATDLFAVGVILHELLTGHPPWPRARIHEAMNFLQLGDAGRTPPLAHLNRMSLPVPLERTLRTMLKFRLQDRPQSANDVLERLAHAESEPMAFPKTPTLGPGPHPRISPPSPTPRAPPPLTTPVPMGPEALPRLPSKTPWFVSITLILSAAAIAGSILVFVASRPETPLPLEDQLGSLLQKQGVVAVRRFCRTHAPEIRKDPIVWDAYCEVWLSPPVANRPSPPQETPETELPLGDEVTPEDQAESPAKTISPPKRKRISKPKPTKPQNGPKPIFDEGNRLLLTGDFARAERKFKDCLQINPRFAPCHRSLGILYARQDDTVNSIRHYRRYLVLKPNAQDADAVREMLANLGDKP